MMAFCPEHPKWHQNPRFTPLSETTIITTPFICGVHPLPPPGIDNLQGRFGGSVVFHWAADQLSAAYESSGDGHSCPDLLLCSALSFVKCLSHAAMLLNLIFCDSGCNGRAGRLYCRQTWKDKSSRCCFLKAFQRRFLIPVVATNLQPLRPFDNFLRLL